MCKAAKSGHRTSAVRGALSVVVVLCAAGRASASEVTVQNDSFMSGGSAVIVGDFVAGEQAGVRLTSTCAGTIVAVQIGWLAGSGSGQQTLHRAINIYKGTSFPTPGALILRLEAPLLTSGFLNEFRYIDENNVTPLSIPIASGERFFVTVEFDEATDVANGGPSVFRDVNGCQAGRNVLFATPGGWLNFCTFISGDLVIRAVIDCGLFSGACCLPSGSCNTLTADQCQDAGGEYHGNNVTCAETECEVVGGACCFSNGTCAITTVENCGAGAFWHGLGTNCDDLDFSGTADICELACEPCDANCDGSINLFDIDPFVTLLGSGGGQGCAACTGDTNGDGSVNLFDIDPFVTCLGG